MRKNILITGVTGFIGSHLAETLCEKGDVVTGIDKSTNSYRKRNPRMNFILGDIRTIELTGKYDIIYHLAALTSIPESFIYPDEYLSTNILGTYRIIEAYPNTRIVFASSSAAQESKCVYGASKRSAEHLINMNKNSVSIRFMNVFGELQYDLTKAIPSFCLNLKHNKKAIINGDGSIQRDYTYVLDLVTEFIKIGESRIKGQTEIGYGTPISILDLYKLLVRTAKKKENFKFGPPRKGDMKYTCSKYKIKEPRYGFLEGIRKTVRWCMAEETF
jgi:UDP-glucose 4-epimerase